MKIKLNFGYNDREDVVADCEEYLKNSNVAYALEEDEYGQIFVYVMSPWRFEIKKFGRKFLGEGKSPDWSDLADTIIDENIAQP